MLSNANLGTLHNYVGYDGDGFDHSAGRRQLDSSAAAQLDGFTQVGACGQNIREAKVIVLGDAGVGKTSLLERVARGVFHTDYKVTIGVDFLNLNYKVFGVPITLAVWDTAGQEKYHSLARQFYSGAEAVVLCYDENEPDTAESVFSRWLPGLQSTLGEEALSRIPVLLIGNKIDKASFIDHKEIDSRARSNNMETYRLSVKDDWVGSRGGGQESKTQVKGVFDRIACLLVERALLSEVKRGGPAEAPAPAPTKKVVLTKSAPYGESPTTGSPRIRKPPCCN